MALVLPFDLITWNDPQRPVWYLSLWLHAVVPQRYIDFIIIKSEVSTFPIVFIFFRGCVPEMFVSSYSVTYCIYIPGNREFVFISIEQFMMSANSWIRFGLQIIFVCLYITPSHYHHCANFIWRHWTYKIPVRYNLSSVWVRLSILSQLSIIQYVGLCVFSLPISFVMIERIYILCLIIIIKSEVWTITHCLGLGHETMVCAVCLSIFLYLGASQLPLPLSCKEADCFDRWCCPIPIHGYFQAPGGPSVPPCRLDHASPPKHYPLDLDLDS